MFTRDNLEVMRGIDSDCIDLIYLDPPFNSKHNYAAPIGSEAAGAAFKDTWTLEDIDDEWIGLIADEQPALSKLLAAVPVDSDKAYLVYMSVRLLEMHRILKPTGSIYLHCDPTMSAWLRIVLDAIFGKKNFRNEIVWHYTGNSMPLTSFPAKHDTILFYFKSDQASFSPVLIPYAKSTLRRYNHTDETGKRYKISALRNGKQEKVYMGEGKMADSVWEVPIVRKKNEKVGYPTQKPLPLLERIIKASSNEGDFVFDPFCGCATACVAAEKLHRQWVGIDISPKAAELVRRRAGRELTDILSSMGTQVYDIIHRTDIPVRSNGERVKPADVKHKLYGQQEGHCNGCRTHFEFRHFHVDHIIPKAKGGQDRAGNLQLLCGHCNSIKGDRDMSYLMKRLSDLNI